MMGYYRLRPEHVRRELFYAEAVQWFKIGDHPAVEPIYGAGTMVDEACGHRSDEHGWLDFRKRRDPQAVCPGDWILTFEGTGQRARLHPHDFERLYRPARRRKPEPQP